MRCDGFCFLILRTVPAMLNATCSETCGIACLPLLGMKDQRFHRTKQKFGPFSSGKGSKLAGLETVFNLIEIILSRLT